MSEQRSNKKRRASSPPPSPPHGHDDHGHDHHDFSPEPGHGHDDHHSHGHHDFPPSHGHDDDDDILMAASAAPSLTVIHDPQAVKLCASLLQMLEQVKKLVEGQAGRACRFSEEKPGADIYELALDPTSHSFSMKRVQEVVEGLKPATMAARENLARDIIKRKADIAGLEEEGAALTTKIQENQGEGVESVVEQLSNVHAMIEKHKKALHDLEAKTEVEVKVKVHRFSTCVELVKNETTSEEVRMVPKRDAGIYVLGGTCKVNNRIAALSSVERYDVEHNIWEPVAPMNCKRAGHGSAVLGSKIYAVGGWCDDPLKSVECFSPKSGRWELMAPLTMPRDGCAVAALNGRLYVAGGNAGKSYLSSLTVLGEEANWKQDLAPMNYRRRGAAGAVLEGLFYVVGGYDGKERCRSVERYDPTSNTWELVAPMNSQRNQCAVAVCNGYLYALGGADDSANLSSVERFDPRNNRWEEVASMQYKRKSAAAAVLDGRIFVMGGTDNFVNASYLSSAERYDPETNRWELVAPLSSARFRPTAVVAT